MPGHVPWLLASAAVAWAAALPLAAWSASHGSAPLKELALAIYAFGYGICHQRPERSFAWGEVPWPVCARCAGIYMGAAVGVLIGLRGTITRPLPASLVRRSLIVAALPSLLTAVFEWAAGHPPSNLTRGASGIVLGGVAAGLVVRFVREPIARVPVADAEVN